jgi:hypothetical protein
LTEIVRSTIALNASFFNTHRMLQEMPLFTENGSVCGNSLVRSEKNFGFCGQKFHGGWDMISYESQGQRSIHFLANCSHLRMICPLLALSVWKFALKLQAPAG